MSSLIIVYELGTTGGIEIQMLRWQACAHELCAHSTSTSQVCQCEPRTLATAVPSLSPTTKIARSVIEWQRLLMCIRFRNYSVHQEVGGGIRNMRSVPRACIIAYVKSEGMSRPHMSRYYDVDLARPQVHGVIVVDDELEA